MKDSDKAQLLERTSELLASMTNDRSLVEKGYDNWSCHFRSTNERALALLQEFGEGKIEPASGSRGGYYVYPKIEDKQKESRLFMLDLKIERFQKISDMLKV
jgi:hypothetical protein